jgi:hypothetical protein
MFEPGQILTHSAAPDLGRMRINAVTNNHIYVSQENAAGGEEKTFQIDNAGLVLAKDQTSTGFPARRALEVLGVKKRKPSAKGVTKKVPNAWPFDEAYKRFEAKYPGGFGDAAFLKDEREVKTAARARWQEQFGPNGLSQLQASKNPEEAAKAFVKVNTGLNLLHPIEFAKFKSALASSPNSLALAQELVAAADEGSLSEARFNSLLKAYEACGIKTGLWTLLTHWLYLGSAKGFPFMKPTITKAAAEGLALSLNYETKPSYAGYQKVVELYDKLWTLLEPKGAKDWQDLQSFVWIGWSA